MDHLKHKLKSKGGTYIIQQFSEYYFDLTLTDTIAYPVELESSISLNVMNHEPRLK